MNLRKIAKLKGAIKRFGRVAVAVSGGLDSCTLLKECAKQLGPENCLALCEKTPYCISSEIATAADFCKKLGVAYVEEKFAMPRVLSNNPQNRCYLCKKILFERLKKIAKKKGFEVLLDGSNVSDLSDYRPGREAAKQLGVKSPFEDAGFKKSDILELAEKLGLEKSIRLHGANSCMLTRFPFGKKIILSELKKAERAENFLRGLGLRNPRVRVHGNLARVELQEKDFELFLRRRMFNIVAKEFKSLGYAFCALDMGGYRKGSFNNVQGK